MSDEAFARLRDAIISGELPPGAPLRDFEIAETFGTSKTPIRHALDRLGEQGLVEIQRNRYSRVADVDPRQAGKALDVLGDLWGGAVRRVTPLLQKEEATALSGLTKNLSAAVKKRGLSEFANVLFALATSYSRIEGNTARAATIEQLAAQVSRFWLVSADSFDWSAARELATDISEGIKTRNPDLGVGAVVTFFDKVTPVAPED